jgi:hypothetical protein
VVLGPRLAAIGWVRSSFFPRATRATTNYQRRPTGDRGGPADGAPRGASHASAARRPRVARRRADASTCSPTRTPSPAAASATAAPLGARRGCPSTPPGPTRAVGPSVVHGAWGGEVAAERLAPRADHRAGVGTCPTVPRHHRKYKRLVTDF